MPGKPGFPFVPGSPYHRKHIVIQDKLHDLIQRLQEKNYKISYKHTAPKGTYYLSGLDSRLGGSMELGSVALSSHQPSALLLLFPPLQIYIFFKCSFNYSSSLFATLLSKRVNSATFPQALLWVIPTLSIK